MRIGRGMVKRKTGLFSPPAIRGLILKTLPLKTIILSGACAALLAACASSGSSAKLSASDFGPAYGSDFGYRNTQLQQDRFRISYTSRDPYQSYDFALLRAAQIATNEGYSHFEIIGGDGYDNGPNRIAANIGTGFGGRGYNRTHVGIGVADLERTLDGRIVTETIEVILQPGPPTVQNRNVFEAQSVIRNIVPRNLAVQTQQTQTQQTQTQQQQTLPPTVVTP